MGTYALEMVIEYWRTGRLTAEQVIGQMLQFLQEHRKRLDELEDRLREVEKASKRMSESG
jgi:tryptophanyl-tRNA synthetase